MAPRQTRCGHCHRYLVGAPHPDLGHLGAAGGSLCNLDHHPNPFGWSDGDTVCDFYENIVSEDHDEQIDGAVSLQAQLQQALSERDAERRQVELLALANANLNSVHSQLLG